MCVGTGTVICFSCFRFVLLWSLALTLTLVFCKAKYYQYSTTVY